ncbi:hypothetical protein N781_06175 [Pontibacillus halophilus JSM 076056 = DSM 19796]|uniref:Small, acid-soluble spore protein L n=1 Tax=Pontibacillus halophilus JSM 076056 = DSM 19796 TaxID=1385510 RepID=A0A0A5GIJ1_9BACI|nr:small, acid-soluble spore protein L [Pontibacillus halophilus]KGX90950.1 hypothetical protein N781_06175 [Pontibacillus halophilus JSM 076056 = DSM 19796]
MGKKSQNKGLTEATSVNKQGRTEDQGDQQPHTQLEERAKKKNTK